MSNEFSLIRVRLVPMYPLSILRGGFEHQCIKTSESLQEIGVSAKLIDWSNPFDSYDILHLFGPSPAWYDICFQAVNQLPIVITAIAAATTGKPILYKLASGIASWGSSLLKQSTSYARTRQVLQMAERVICNNNLESEFFTWLYNLPENKVRIIPNGVSESRFSGDKHLFEAKYSIHDYVLFVGKIVARKNPLRLAHVLKKMGWPGVFIGGTLPAEQNYASRFEAFVDDAPNLIWIKELEYDDPLLDSAYAGARVFCLPSMAETQSLAALEAMAAGLPIILGNSPYAYQKPFENVVRVNPENLEELESGLLKVIKRPADYRILLPRKYSWTHTAEMIAKLYLELIV